MSIYGGDNSIETAFHEVKTDEEDFRKRRVGFGLSCLRQENISSQS